MPGKRKSAGGDSSKQKALKFDAASTASDSTVDESGPVKLFNQWLFLACRADINLFCHVIFLAGFWSGAGV